MVKISGKTLKYGIETQKIQDAEPQNHQKMFECCGNWGNFGVENLKNSAPELRASPRNWAQKSQKNCEKSLKNLDFNPNFRIHNTETILKILKNLGIR